MKLFSERLQKLKASREKAGITQKELAKLMHSGQSRIAMRKGGSSDVSLDKGIYLLQQRASP